MQDENLSPGSSLKYSLTNRRLWKVGKGQHLEILDDNHDKDRNKTSVTLSDCAKDFNDEFDAVTAKTLNTWSSD